MTIKFRQKQINEKRTEKFAPIPIYRNRKMFELTFHENIQEKCHGIFDFIKAVNFSSTQFIDLFTVDEAVHSFSSIWFLIQMIEISK